MPPTKKKAVAPAAKLQSKPPGKGGGAKANTTSVPTTSLDIALVRKAVAALFTYEAKVQESKPEALIDEYAKPIIASVQLYQQINKKLQRPIRLPIPYSMYSPEDEGHSLCFFCRTQDRESFEKLFALDGKHFKGLTKIISVAQLGKLYKEIKDRKKLLAEHTHFACDARVMTHVYNMLGKTFGARNNYPVAIDFEKASKLHQALQLSVDSTYMHLKGASISIRLGHTGMNPNDVAQNVLHGLEYAVAKMKGGWKAVQNVHLKTPSSPALPIFNRSGGDISLYIKASQKASTEPDSVLEAEQENAKGSKRKALDESESESVQKKTTAVKSSSKKQKTVEEKSGTPKKSTPIAKKTRSQKK